MSPLLSTFAGAGSRAFGLLSGALLNISDFFTRSAGSLGIATSGQAWVALKGSWTTNGSQATSSNSGSTYPIGSIPFQQNVIASADVNGGGPGLAFWVTDANNWWASYPTYIENVINTCNQTLVTGGSNPPSASCCAGVYTTGGGSSCNSSSITWTGYDYEPSFGRIGPSSACCEPQHIVAYGSPYDTYGCNTAYGANPTYYNCYTSTTTTYSYDTRIVIVSSVSGSVVTDSTTTLVSGAGSLSSIASMKTETTSTQIIVKAYSGAGLTSQLGSTITRTPTTPIRGTSVGIVKGPSTYNQGSTLDNFKADKPV